MSRARVAPLQGILENPVGVFHELLSETKCACVINQKLGSPSLLGISMVSEELHTVAVDH